MEKRRAEEPMDKETMTLLTNRMASMEANKTAFLTVEELDIELKKIIDKN